MLTDHQAMEVELELDTKMKDVSEVIEKLSPVLKSIKDLGFVVRELEIESDDDEDNEEKGNH
jgi:hypothetical protein